MVRELQEINPSWDSGSGIQHQTDDTLGPIRGYNIGGDYHFKRLLLVDWPGGTVEAHTFGEA